MRNACRRCGHSCLWRRIKHRYESPDSGYCIVNDGMASTYLTRCKAANHQGLFEITMFSPDAFGDLLTVIRIENDTAQTEEQV